MAPAAELVAVTRTYKDVTAVADLDLNLHPGTIYGLLGPNGSGKTTSLNLLIGLIRPDRGEVRLLGGAPTDRSRARVGYVPEKRALPMTAHVTDLLVFFARMRGFSNTDAKQMATDQIGRLELEDKADAKIKTLSNGQQQKVQIAMALMCRPDVILLDEPLTGLDPNHQELVSARIRDAARGGAMVLLSTHRLREAEHMVDHVVMLAQGHKILDQPLDEALREAFDGTWRVVPDGDDLSWIDGPDVVDVVRGDKHVTVKLSTPTPAALLGRAAEAGAPLLGIEAQFPTLHELYLARNR